MNPLRPALALVLAATLCASGLPSASALTPRARSAASSDLLRAPATRSVETTPDVADNTLIVRLKGGTTAEALSQVYDAVDTSAGAVSVIRGDVLSWQVPADETIIGFAEKLQDTGRVTYAEPNYVRYLAGYTPPAYVEPNDPAYLDAETWGYSGGNERYPYAKSWWIRNVKGISAWKTGYTGPNIVGQYPLRSSGTEIKVAVLDTGFYTDHPDASSYIIAGSSHIAPVDQSLASGSTTQERTTMVSHGTCVAGIIGAAVNNGQGTLGLGNDTQVAIYRVYVGGSGIADDDIIAAIRKAADDGCRVINMSLAGGEYNVALQAAIDYAWSKGCVIVAATGNNGVGSVSYPAAMEHVVGVGGLALDANGQPKHASFSNYGATLDISAPGAWIWGLTKPGNVDPDFGVAGYRWWDGTSMASPVVAGGIAWLWRAMPNLSNQEIVDLVEGTATDLGQAGRDDLFGYGALDLSAAYASLMSEYPLLQRPSLSATASPDGLSAALSWTSVPGYGVTYDLIVDGTTVASGLTALSGNVSLAPRVTSLTYRRGQLSWGHTPADGNHEVAVVPRSPRNWADGMERAAATVVTPGGTGHVDSLTIDGVPIAVTDNGLTGTLSTANLALGQHTAVMQITDNLGHVSAPVTLVFTVRPAATVKRTTGSSRYSYATAVSRSAFSSAGTAVLVGGSSWTDALSAAPLARMVGGPVLVTSRTSLPKTTKTELARLRVKKIIIVGDTHDVSAKLKRSLKKRYRSVTRISGKDRYTTANAVARSMAKRSGGRIPGGKVVVVGNSYTDAIAASAVAARKGWPLLYAHAGSVPTSTRKTISAIHATSSLVIGSGSKVSAKARRKLPSSTRVSSTSTLYDPTLLATWTTTHYPADFSGERIYVASSSKWIYGLGIPAAAAQHGGLVLVTKSALASAVRSYYTTNSEVAVTTRVVAGSKVISASSVDAIKGIVGAP